MTAIPEALQDSVFSWDPEPPLSPEVLEQMDFDDIFGRLTRLTNSVESFETTAPWLFPSSSSATAHPLSGTALTDIVRQPHVSSSLSVPQNALAQIPPHGWQQPQVAQVASDAPTTASTSIMGGTAMDEGYQFVDVNQPTYVSSPTTVSPYHLQPYSPVPTPSATHDVENPLVDKAHDEKYFQLIDPTEVPGYFCTARAVTFSETLNVDVPRKSIMDSDPVQGVYHWKRRPVAVCQSN